jgi:uncharacterized protein (TIGR03067 family)
METTLDGVWIPVRTALDGAWEPEERVPSNSRCIFLFGQSFEGWSGLWAVYVVRRSHRRTELDEITQACRCAVLYHLSDFEFETFYLLVAGRFRISEDSTPKQIDMEQCYAGSGSGHPALGIYAIEANRLTICLLNNWDGRPARFHERGSLVEYIRDQ